MPVGAALGAASLGGSLIAARASQKASQAQVKAGKEATGVQQKMFEETRGDLAPFTATGKSAAMSLADFYGLSPTGGGQTGQTYNPAALDAFYKSPDYQFALNQGILGLDRSAAARGALQSGGQQKAVLNYASGLASTNLGSYLDRLYQLAGMGESAGAQTGSFATSTGRGIADTMLGTGEARASGIVGAANAINSGIGNAANNLTFYRLMQGGNPSAYSSASNPAVLSFNRQFQPSSSSSFLY